ncbi:YdiU family protein [Pseudoxanthomonas sp. JBR18]|uniref:protein adenylyltransferase SelO n=1 Tax=Pseudoxanthomonas sp. JBR18 TaxID=2969308 RepID=UPI0023051A9C|nr:YdiU family protein [Pseudoxanthomonas sp. JBR18]WCE04117.1 YdiU family protein [Pseudoxanthomonas sp. JBR18]
MELHFDNTLLRALPRDPIDGPQVRQVPGAVWSSVAPTPVAAPRVLAWSPEVAALLGLKQDDIETAEFAQVFGGNALLPGMVPYATNYGGHQFGNWAGQLGDGRAISLGEAIAADGSRQELQLKGAGPTPYSRFADGRAVLRSSIREFLCSEAMAHLGVPTTRALCLVGTGEDVVRDMFYDGHAAPEPGAVVCRVAPSFLRLGHYELPAARGDTALLRRLVDFTIERDFPELSELAPGAERDAAWFTQICTRTAVLMAHWMRVGFVHGVMNTDNLSVLGLTIDYGPYGWIDDYDPDWTPNTTDAQGRRYRFGWQPQVAFWNLSRLAGALSLLFADPAPLQEALQAYADTYAACERADAAAKLGLPEGAPEAPPLMAELRGLLHGAEVDMTLFFRGLGDHAPGPQALAPLADAFYDPDKYTAHRPAFEAWLTRYAALCAGEDDEAARQRRMRAANPRYVLRNYLAQEAIDRAHDGDLTGVHELLEVLRHPYDDQPGREAFARKRPDWARTRAGCSMLSCSS